ncbi:TIGR02301 family protein [Cohaesibacter celericrescens]|jgi:uncharacterized protein (TIGR02301 family)|uniref:TIGR02301 family protein n=1 Tax=Cohaesibacter celericrescens TaxID=2067669 RepID=UPI003568943D
MLNLRPISTFSKRTALLLMLMLFTTGQTPSTATAADGNLPPYEQSLRRLSSIVGALMYLDPLCNNSQAASWHDQMAALLEAENADDSRRRQLIDRFNRSYSSYARTYTSCNSQAAKITALYHTEAQELLTNMKLRHAR